MSKSSNVTSTGEAKSIPLRLYFAVQIDVLVDSMSEDGELIGRSQWDAPDVDPIVFLSQQGKEEAVNEQLEIGQMWRCRITGSCLFDLEAQPVMQLS